MIRICDGTTGDRPCPRRNPCEGDCHFNTAGLRPREYVCFMKERHLILASWALVVAILAAFIVPVVWLIGVLI